MYYIYIDLGYTQNYLTDLNRRVVGVDGFLYLIEHKPKSIKGWSTREQAARNVALLYRKYKAEVVDEDAVNMFILEAAAIRAMED